MRENLQKYRLLYNYLPRLDEEILVLITGSRQTGKTTSAKHFYPKLNYYNLDALEYRQGLLEIPTFNWGNAVGNAIIDEIQKEPSVLDKIKYAFDEKQIRFSVLTGSSQILLLNKISETLAGRILLFELFPLCLVEIITDHNDSLPQIILDRIIQTKSVSQVCKKYEYQLFSPKLANIKEKEDYLLKWGGMPSLLHLKNNRKKDWLRSFENTYLEKDLSDLARLRDLLPFKKLQKLAALRSSKLLSFSELSKDAGISIETTRRYMEYLKLSYQVFFLQPYYRNITSSMIKTPKIYWYDIGVLRQLCGVWDIITGSIFENYVISEIAKYIKTCGYDIGIYFYRTRSGMEVDLILEINGKLLTIEIKSREQVYKKDISNIQKIANSIKSNWLGGIVIYRGDKIFEISKNIWAIPSYRLLS